MSKTTLRTVKDPKSVNGIRYKRVPRNWQERVLKWLGWQPAGIALLEHPRYNHGTPMKLSDAWEKEKAHWRAKFDKD